jgi:hypothetical protein
VAALAGHTPYPVYKLRDGGGCVIPQTPAAVSVRGSTRDEGHGCFPLQRGGNGARRSLHAHREHQRIDRELEQAQSVLATTEAIATHIHETLSRALSLIKRCDEVYRLGGPRVRRLSNQAFFEKLLITDDPDGAKVAGAVMCEPWASLLAEDLRKDQVRNGNEPRPS